MLGTSICPHCDANLNIGEAQIDVVQGLVRCGRCLEIFDFRISYIANQASAQLELPISDQHIVSYADTPDDRITEALAEARHREIFGDNDTTEWHEGDIQTVDLAKKIKPAITDAAHDIETLASAEEHESNSSHPSKTLVIKPTGMGKPQKIDYEFSNKPRRVWPWAIAATLLLLTLIVQATYFFRADLAANFPVTKPALVRACEFLKCTVSLPQNSRLMSIESSSLEDAPFNHVTLNALLRNHAAYAQAFPNLELTLTDTQDNPQARRIFKPADYLPPAEKEATGLLPNHEVNIKLHLDIMDIKPAGYRLLLFYP